MIKNDTTLRKRTSPWITVIVAILLLPAFNACSDSQDSPTLNPTEEPGLLSPDATEVPAYFFKNRTAPMPLPSTLVSISDYAFYGCQNEYVVIPDNVVHIGEFAFKKNHIYHDGQDSEVTEQPKGTLKSIYVPKSVTQFDKGCFVGVARESWLSFDSDRYEDDFIDNPKIILESTEPQMELFTQGLMLNPTYIFNHFDNNTPKYDIYVPESAVEKISGRFWNWLDSCLLETKDPEKYFSWAYYQNLKGNLQFIPYKPLAVSIEKKTEGNHIIFSYETSNDNEARISHVRWRSTNPEAASLETHFGNAYVEILKEGKAYLEIKFITRLENGEELEFYKYIKL